MRKASRIALKVGLLGGMIAALTGCSSAHAAPPRAVVLIDLSGSTKDSTVRAGYLRDLELVAQVMAARHGSVFAELIGRNPTADSATPIVQDFAPSPRVAGNMLFERSEASKRLEAVMAQARTLLASEPQYGTDVVSGVLLAARILNRSRPGGEAHLVILSDMAQSHDPNLYRAPLTSGSVKRLVRELRGQGRVPDLTGIRVHVAGAGLDPHGKLSAARNFAIERFWRAYFEASGAILAPGWYAARLAGFDEQTGKR